MSALVIIALLFSVSIRAADFRKLLYSPFTLSINDVPPLIDNLLGGFVIRVRFLADVQKTTHFPFSRGPRLREPLREPCIAA